MWKKNIIKIIKKNKILIYYILIELNFQMTFFHWSIHDKKKYLYYSKCYFINLSI
jgi:hypothetical protein